MTGISLGFSRGYDLPPSIVWDALVDPVLLEGWLATATIDLRVGGEYRLDWIEPTHLVSLVGEITVLEPGQVLGARTGAAGSVRWRLLERPGGPRGSSTDLVVEVASDLDPRFAPGTIAHWESNLDQLGQLLHGHPVDWSNWDRDRGADWGDHFERAVRDLTS